MSHFSLSLSFDRAHHCRFVRLRIFWRLNDIIATSGEHFFYFSRRRNRKQRREISKAVRKHGAETRAVWGRSGKQNREKFGTELVQLSSAESVGYHDSRWVKTIFFLTRISIVPFGVFEKFCSKKESIVHAIFSFFFRRFLFVRVQKQLRSY